MIYCCVKMKPDELGGKIANGEEVSISDVLSAIAEDGVQIYLIPTKGKKKEIEITRLKHGKVFTDLAIKYSQDGSFRESELIFEAMNEKTPNDADTIHNYATVIINKAINLYKCGKAFDKCGLGKARKLVFLANNHNKKVNDDWRTKTPYKNLCYLRAIEAANYYNQKDPFTAFVLGWMSVEMTLYQIWFEVLKKRIAQDTESLMRWNIDYVIETLFLCDDDKIKSLKKDLDTLKGTRNHLLHGEIDNPTLGQAKICIDTALSLLRPDCK